MIINKGFSNVTEVVGCFSVKCFFFPMCVEFGSCALLMVLFIFFKDELYDDNHNLFITRLKKINIVLMC